MTKLSGPQRLGDGTALVVFLHGYGADGNDLIGLAEPLSGVLPGVDFVSPHAPEPCRAAPMGRQWFPIPWIDGSSEAEMLSSFAASTRAVHAFIDEALEARGLGADKCALVGFSQGTMMSLHIGPRRPQTLAGIVGFSGALAAPERLEAELVTRPPVTLIHGDADEVLPAAETRRAAETLRGLNVPTDVTIRPGLGHGIDPEGMSVAARFLRQVLGLGAEL